MERRRLSVYEYTGQTAPMQSELCALSIRKDSTLCLPTDRIDANELGTQRIATERRREEMSEKNAKQLEHMYEIGVQLERKRIFEAVEKKYKQIDVFKDDENTSHKKVGFNEAIKEMLSIINPIIEKK